MRKYSEVTWSDQVDLHRTEGCKFHCDFFRLQFCLFCCWLLQTLAISKIVLSPSFFQMTFSVSTHSNDSIRSYECCTKRCHRFTCVPTPFFSKKIYPICQWFCSAGKSTRLQFPPASYDPLKGFVVILIDFFNRFSVLSLSLFVLISFL